MTALPSIELNRERSRAQLAVVLFTIALALLFVQLFANPYVITVKSTGCWSINTDGLFNHFNVQGCGNQSWMMIDLYARVHSIPLANAPTVPGGGDMSIFLSQGPGSGGSCVGGHACTNLSGFSPPSPLACNSCVVTQLGLNPTADSITSGNGATLATYPFVGWILLVYLALAIRNGLRTYSSYIRGERQNLDWKAFTSLRKTLTVFSLCFLAYTTYQFIAIWLSLFVRPVPQFGLIGEGLVLILVTVWLARFLGWKFPFQTNITSLPSTMPL
jgi:hypothetical protein